MLPLLSSPWPAQVLHISPPWVFCGVSGFLIFSAGVLRTCGVHLGCPDSANASRHSQVRRPSWAPQLNSASFAYMYQLQSLVEEYRAAVCACFRAPAVCTEIAAPYVGTCGYCCHYVLGIDEPRPWEALEPLSVPTSVCTTTYVPGTIQMHP